VGWALDETLEAELALAALAMAFTQRRPAPGLLHHSDRGSQYTSAAYQALLAAHGAEFIEPWYNRERRHSSLGYRSPVAFELVVLQRGRAA